VDDINPKVIGILIFSTIVSSVLYSFESLLLLAQFRTNSSSLFRVHWLVELSVKWVTGEFHFARPDLLIK